jgi:transposase-like protein
MPPVDRLKPTRGRSSESSVSLMEFMREFPNDEACLEYLWRTRHSPDGETAYCPKCDRDRTFKRYAMTQRRQSWTCLGCGHHVHPTAGTIFHKSSTSLHLWFYAMYLITSTRCGISAKHLERELGVHYKTAADVQQDSEPADDAGRRAAVRERGSRRNVRRWEATRVGSPATCRARLERTDRLLEQEGHCVRRG